MVEPTSSYIVAGVKLTPLTSDELLERLQDYVQSGRQCVVAYQNLHGLVVHAREATFRALHDRAKTIVQIDGMPLVMLCRIAGIRARRAHRVTWVDFIGPLLSRAERQKWGVYYLGGSPEVLDRGLAVIRQRYPGLAVAGRHGYFEEGTEAEAVILAEIRRMAPSLVLVGMGMGRQERWIERNLDTLNPSCMLTSGACIEYLAGVVRTPPRWMGRWGLEWLFRLIESPQRFGHRYLVEPWAVVLMIISRLVKRTI